MTTTATPGHGTTTMFSTRHATLLALVVASAFGTPAVAQSDGMSNDLVSRAWEAHGVPQRLVDPDEVLDLAEVHDFVSERLLGQDEAIQLSSFLENAARLMEQSASNADASPRFIRSIRV